MAAWFLPQRGPVPPMPPRRPPAAPGTWRVQMSERAHGNQHGWVSLGGTYASRDSAELRACQFGVSSTRAFRVVRAGR